MFLLIVLLQRNLTRFIMQKFKSWVKELDTIIAVSPSSISTHGIRTLNEH